MSDESYKNDTIVIINTTDKIFLSFYMPLLILFSIPDETQINFIMANVKFPYDEMCDSYSKAESPKSKCSSIKSRLLHLKASLCKHNSIDSDISVNDSASDSASEPSFHSMSTNSDNSYRSTIDVEENLEINNVFRQPSENFNKYGDIIKQIEKLRFSRESSQNGKKILNSRRNQTLSKLWINIKSIRLGLQNTIPLIRITVN